MLKYVLQLYTRGQDVRACFSLSAAIIAALFVALAMGGATWPAASLFAQAATPTPAAEAPEADAAPIPDAPPHAARGRLLYAENCAPCHGETGAGDGAVAADLPGPPSALADPETVRDSTPAEWFLVTKYGRMDQMMPPWEARMSDAEIWQTVFYAWGLHVDRAMLDEGEMRYSETCAVCHGPQGAGDGPDAPESLPDFTNLGYTSAQSPADWHAGWQAAHPELGADWASTEQYAVLETLRAFSYVPVWQPVAREGDGVLAGQVMLGTPDAVPPQALEVRLETYADFELVNSTTAPVDEEGRFRFEGLPLGPDVVYLAVAEYDEVQYSSPIVTLSEEEPAVETQILLYARTDDASGVAIEQVNWVVEPQSEGFLVGQIVTFSLAGDRTYAGATVEGIETPVTVALYAPPGAENVRLENGVIGGRYHRSGDLIYDTVPIAPGMGTHQLVMRYIVPLDAEPMTLRNEFIYPVSRLNLLVADIPQVEIDAPGLTPMGVQDFQNTAFQVWQGQDLTPGPLPVHFFGLSAGVPSSAAVILLQPGVIWGVGGFVTVALLVGLTAGWRQGRFRPAHEAIGLQQQRSHLLQSIARLDDLHAAGVLAEAEWQAQRAHLKVQLLDVAARLEAQADPTQSQGELVTSPSESLFEKSPGDAAIEPEEGKL